MSDASRTVDNEEVLSLTTLQYRTGGPFDLKPVSNLIHLICRTAKGTPGDTLCGLPRFGPNVPGWSVGGRSSGNGFVPVACPGCIEKARLAFAGTPVEDTKFSHLFTGATADIW